MGLSYRTAPLAVRERLALPEARQLELLQRLGEAPAEALLISTCNRVELYLTAPDVAVARQRARVKLERLGGTEVLEHLYEHQGEAALLHLFRVASSLDSMVLGEAQVLGQVKDALEQSQTAGTARGELSRMFAAAFRCAKRVRTETGIGMAATSMAGAAVALANRTLGGLEGKTVLLVGAGEMAGLAARHLKQAGAGLIVVVNRTLSRAEALAAEVEGIARPFDELFTLLVSADAVVSGTSSPVPLFHRENVAAVLEERGHHRPLVLVDLAVPRNIAAGVDSLAQVRLHDLDDIQRFVAHNEAVRAEEARKASQLVDEEVARFLRDQAVREGMPVLCRLRQRADAIARAEVERTLSSLGETLSDKQRKSVEAMARAIINKLLHEPTARLRTIGVEPEGEQYAHVVADLFGLIPT
ncbi:glutamyl-tRNA reductase [Vitiosangium sp. GDMCC 1.1324]|uniref:glutamyl-tRNA reductase n=1 Tax=Vitiosangium sp. (strain GDMCC 1.1324) TaxID=2138576 RepID=UPI001E543229|nr:glutamyl-tRNA reductase [Vitiosangium sp. GDMCC 1.1324]